MIVQDVLKRIDDLCQERGITKDELYRGAEVSRAALSQWRTGRTSPSVQKLRDIADFFGVTYEYLATGVQSEQKEKLTPKGEPKEYARETMQLLSELGDCTDSEVHEVLKYVRFVKSQRSE